MTIPITQELTGLITDFEILVEDRIPPEKPANACPPHEVVVLVPVPVPDGVAYTLDRHNPPGALRLRIFVEAQR